MKLSVEQMCPYCGQFVAINVDEDTPLSDREGMAKMKCGCPQAAREREIREACDKLESVCGGDATNNGFEYPLDDILLGMCREAIKWIIDGEVGEIQMRCPRGDKLKLRGGSAVKITRECKKRLEL